MSLIRIAYDVGLAGTLLLCLPGCPGDSTGDSGADGTGGSGTTESSTEMGDVLNCGEPGTPPSAPEGPFLDCEIDQECIGTLTLFDTTHSWRARARCRPEPFR
jgi:hypothetical protein